MPLSDRDAAERFSAAAIPFPAADLAKAARRTKAAAKGWKDASRAPGLASIINMARALPALRQWLASEIGAGARDAQANSIDAVLRGLYAIASGTGEEAMTARRIIVLINQPEQPAAAREDPVVRDLFKQRR